MLTYVLVKFHGELGVGKVKVVRRLREQNSQTWPEVFPGPLSGAEDEWPLSVKQGPISDRMCRFQI